MTRLQTGDGRAARHREAMYEHHLGRERPDSTDWAILSPSVPVFRTDDGSSLAEPRSLDVITCAAPYAPTVGQPEAGDLLERRFLGPFRDVFSEER